MDESADQGKEGTHQQEIDHRPIETINYDASRITETGRDTTAWRTTDCTRVGTHGCAWRIAVLVCLLLQIASINANAGCTDEHESARTTGGSRQGDPWPNTGDWRISEGANIVVSNKTINMNGSIIIDGSSTLTLTHSTVVFDCRTTGQHRFEVQANGQCFISSSTITARNGDFPFQFIVRSNARFVVENSFVNGTGYNATGDRTRQGLYLESNFAEIRESVFSNCYVGIIAMRCSPIIVNNTVRDCRSAGIRIRSTNGLVEGNRIVNSSTGIIADQGTGTIRGNYLHGNYGAGITVLPGSNMTIEENTIIGTDYYTRQKTGIYTVGIDIHGVDGMYTCPNVSGGSVAECFMGISVNTSAAPSFANVTVINSTHLDLRVDGKANASLLNCSIASRKIFVGIDSVMRVFGLLSVKVVRMDGSAVPNAGLEMHVKDGGMLCNTTTDENGNYGMFVVPVFVRTSNMKSEMTPFSIRVSDGMSVVNSQVYVTSGVVTIVMDAYIDIAVAPTDITCSPARPSENQMTTISACVHNVGTTEASEIAVSMMVDETLIGTANVASILPGANALVRFNWTAIPGTHTIFAFVVCGLKEVNDGNNVGEKEVDVKYNLSADIHVQSLERVYSTHSYDAFSNNLETVVPGDLVGFVAKIWCEVDYVDSIPEVNDVEVAFFVDGSDVPEKTTTIECMKTSHSNPFTYYYFEDENEAAIRIYFIWEARLGMHRITVKADPNDNITEVLKYGSEGNNQQMRSITVSAPSPIVQPKDLGLVGACCMIPAVITAIVGLAFLALLRKPAALPSTQRPYYYQGQYARQSTYPPAPYYSSYRPQYSYPPPPGQTGAQPRQYYYYNPATRSWVPSQMTQTQAAQYPSYYHRQPYTYPYQHQANPSQTAQGVIPKYYYNPYTRTWMPYPQQANLDALRERAKRPQSEETTVSKAASSSRKSARITAKDEVKEFEAQDAHAKDSKAQEKIVSAGLDDSSAESSIAPIESSSKLPTNEEGKAEGARTDEKAEVPLQSKSREGIIAPDGFETDQRPLRKVLIVRNCPKCSSENIEMIEDNKVKCNSCGRLFRMKPKPAG